MKVAGFLKGLWCVQIQVVITDGDRCCKGMAKGT